MDDEDSDSDESIESNVVVDESSPFELCSWLCDGLAVPYQVKDTAQSFMTPLSRMLERLSCSPRCIAAVSIYIALHLLNLEDHVIANRLAMLACVSESEERFHSTWRLIYADRMELVVPALLPGLAESHMDGILAFLPAPLAGYDIANNEGDSQMADSRSVPDQERVEILRQLLETLRDADIHDSVGSISEKLVDNMWLMASTEDLNILSERACEAVCAYMACHLMGVAISSSHFSRLYQISERTFHQMYAQVYPRRRAIMSSRIIQILASHNLQRVLDVLPALNWPSP